MNKLLQHPLSVFQALRLSHRCKHLFDTTSIIQTTDLCECGIEDGTTFQVPNKCQRQERNKEISNTITIQIELVENVSSIVRSVWNIFNLKRSKQIENFQTKNG